MDNLKGRRYFSKIDLRDAYNQIRMDPSSEDITSFFCKYGTYCYRVMPFGLSVAPAFFQRMVNCVLQKFLGLEVVCYLDDILISTYSLSQNIKKTEEVITTLETANLFACMEKCEFYTESIEYLGFVIGAQGIAPRKQSLSAIQQYKRPKTLKEIQAFLGTTNFLRNFINEYSKMASSLYSMIKKGKRELVWDDIWESGF
jgi:Reverse transcriptase (RNA-dependent DNA polymerase)